MAKSKKRVKELKAANEATKTVEEHLANSNEAYTQGAFKYLRILVHLLGVGQFIYGIYYQCKYVHWSNDDENQPAHWGGKFKFLTFLDVILQALYHFCALMNDFFGSNDMDPQPVPKLRKIKDYMFAALAFPVAHNVCIAFWVIYSYDRELIFPAIMDSIFPNWLNHIVHTNVSMMAIMDLFTCFRQYPSRSAGLSGTFIFMVLYIIWVHIVRFYSGQWVYPLLEILNMPMRYVMFAALLGFTAVCYLLGEFINNIIWAPEIKILKLKKSK